jgi:hypothetical protein
MADQTAAAEPTIGPPATHLLLENDDVNVWQMSTAAGAKFWPHYHHYDYILFYTTDVLATLDDAPEEHEQTWTPRYGHTNVGAERPAGVMTYAHSLFFIPGTGFLSPGFVNIGDTPMIAPLIEIKRPARAEQQSVGYARTDALVGITPPSGCVHLLENDRVRVYETTLAPGGSDELRPHLDTAVFVIDGATLRIVEEDADGTVRTRVEERTPTTGHWLPGGGRRQLVNAGSNEYRELSVELK